MRPLYAQILFVVLAFSAMVLVSYLFMSNIVHRHMANEANAAIDYTQANIAADLLEPQAALANIAETIRTIIMEIGDFNVMENYMQRMSNYVRANNNLMAYATGVYGYFDVFDGKFVNGLDWTPPDDYMPKERPWYKAAVAANGDVGITEPYNILSIDTIGITYTRRIFDDEGRPLGVVCLDILLDRIRRYAVDTCIAEGGYGILLDREFNVIAHPHPSYIGRALRHMNDGVAIEAELREHTAISEREVIDYRGNASILFVRKLNNGWYMAIITHASDYFSEVKDIGLLLSILGMLMAASLVIVLIRIDVAKQKANILSQQKSNFLATVSHEIRTPLNAILGITEIQMQKRTIPEETTEALSMIYHSGYSLLGIINDILDFSKIEAGKLELMPAKYDMASLLHDTVQLNKMRIGSRKITFKLQVDPFVPAELIGDELRIKQILNNVLSNAFKYTENGEVKLSVAAKYEDRVKEPFVSIIFTVRDTGQGMSPAQVRTLFDEYSRFNLSANRLTEGTGLGMSITNRLVQLMNGKILVASELGKGSTFTVYVSQKPAGIGPLGKDLAENIQQFRFSGASQPKATQVVREPMPYGKVLVVDDVETNLYVAKGLLSPYELSIDTAESGQEAIDKIKAGSEYDIIFMDHMMPQMDGVEATKIMREWGYKRPIVALTANAVVGQAEMFMANGFDDFISKPVDIRQLNVTLNKLIRDIQPPEVLEIARKNSLEKHTAVDAPVSIDPELATIFMRDAEKTIAVLEELYKKRGVSGDEDLRLYTISTHAIKSALANIGEIELSGFARKLEMAGREQNIAVITAETPSFLDKLRAVIKRITPHESEDDDVVIEDDWIYLQEELLYFRAACTVYDKKAAKDVVVDLKKRNWSRPVREMLNTLAEHLLHSDFDEAANIARDFTLPGTDS